VPVVPTVAVRKRGVTELGTALEGVLAQKPGVPQMLSDDFSEHQRQARKIASAAIITETPARATTRNIDRVVLHPVAGPIILATLLFIMFQAVFAWATPFADAISAAITWLSNMVGAQLPPGIFRSFLTDGVIAGVGAVLVFLPLILTLFAFILLLEMTGYMVRAAFLMDRLMAGVGLSGRAFIPLLSSFACAIPGIMATRTIEDPKDRLTTILIAPLMTCSARLPVYAVIIGAFIPARSVGFGIGLQGLVLFALYLSGILGALVAAFALRRTVTKGKGMGFLMEMPRYQMPMLKGLLLGLWQRAWIFLRRAGTIILTSTVILWVLLSFPKTDPRSGISQIDYSVAGRVANGLAVVLKPIGFNRDISLALIPAMAAREVAVSALATVYAIDDGNLERRDQTLADRLKGSWPLPTALAFLAWFVFAPQCISTIAVVRRETNGWKWPLFMVGYLFALAYLAAGAVFWLATAAGL
jgi:ferrous iron transport protein B